jgi:multidrug efflux pump subunit AcrB
MIRRLARMSIRNSVLVHMLVLALLLVGSYSLIQLPRELMSEIAFNWVFVRVDMPSAAAQEVEQQIAIPVEAEIEGVDAVSSVSVRSKEGYAFFSVKFEQVDDDEFNAAYQELKDAVGLVDLPDDAEDPFWVNFSSQDFVPMVQVVLHGEMSKQKMFELAEDLEDDVKAIPGIGKIERGGMQDRQIRVEVDPDALGGYGISIAAVSQALTASNINIPGGLLSVGASEYILRTVGQFDAIDVIGDVIIGTSDSGTVVKVNDIARVVDDYEEANVISRFQGLPAITLSISKQAGGNSIDLVEQLRELADQYNERIEEPGVHVSVTGDTSIQIVNMLSDLETNALFGMGLVIVVLWLFLGLRNALLTALGIPLAFLATFVFMYGTGETLNGNSLFGLVLVLGIIVDDAIVLVENSARHRAMGKSREDAVVDGVAEVGVPVLAAILTTIAAFLPLMLMPGLMGKFMRIIPIVVSMALIASLTEALISLPCHIHEWGEQDLEKLEKRSAWFERFIKPYQAALRVLVGWRLPESGGSVVKGVLGLGVQLASAAGVGITFLLFYLAIPGILFAGFGPIAGAIGAVVPLLGALAIAVALAARGRLMPILKDAWGRLRSLRFAVLSAVYLGMVPAAAIIAAQVDLDLFGGDEIPQFSVRVRMPEGTPLNQTDRVVREMERIAATQVPEGELESVVSNAGLLMAEDEWFIKTNVGQVLVNLVQGNQRDRDLESIMAGLREALERVPGPDSLELVPATSGPPTGADIQLKVQGEDLDRLVELSQVAADEMALVPGVHDVRSDWVLGKRELRVAVDAERAAILGVTERDVGLALRYAFEGIEATRFQDDGEEVPILVRYGEEFRNDLSWVERTRVPAAAGGSVPFQDVAEIEAGRGIDAIRRYKGQRTISLTARVDATITTPVAATGLVQERLSDFDTRFPGYRIDYSGEFEEFQKSLEALLYLGVFGLLLVYMILGTQFRSFSQPLIIIGFTFPGAMLGSAVALFATGTPLSILTLYGLVALLGIVVNDSLVFVTFINAERDRGAAPMDAILEAGQVRLRPIVLTTLTTVIGLMPMAIGLGGKSEAWGPMATTIAVGLLFATATTLFVIPPVYRCFADLGDLASQAWNGALGDGNESNSEPVVEGLGTPQPA